MDNNFVSRKCPTALHAQTASITTMMPTTPDTSLCASSKINSALNSSGIHFPWHKGHERPHPKPESVFVTKAPPRRTKIMPTVVRMANGFNIFFIFSPFHKKFTKLSKPRSLSYNNLFSFRNILVIIIHDFLEKEQ